MSGTEPPAFKRPSAYGHTQLTAPTILDGRIQWDAAGVAKVLYRPGEQDAAHIRKGTSMSGSGTESQFEPPTPEELAAFQVEGQAAP
jgi:hypothetical protein